jgi:hypothetical protein
MTVITMGTNWILAYNLMISKEIVDQTKITALIEKRQFLFHDSNIRMVTLAANNRINRMN